MRTVLGRPFLSRNAFSFDLPLERSDPKQVLGMLKSRISGKRDVVLQER